MKLLPFKLVLFGLYFSLPLLAHADLAEQRQIQREIYGKINEILNQSSSQPTQQLAQQLLEQIQDYPLFPYAEYRLLQANKTQLTLAQIEAYQPHQPNPNFAEHLKSDWLKQRIAKQEWTEILAHADSLPQDTATQCVLLQAENATSSQIQTTDKTHEKNTTLSAPTLPQNKLTALWLTGKSLPSLCDPILAQWHAQGGLTPDLAKQRAVLAFEQGNINLLKHLQQQLTDEANQQWVAGLVSLRNNPLAFTDPHAMFAVQNLSPDNGLHTQILLVAVPAYIKKLPANSLDLSQQLSQFEKWATAFQLNGSQLTDWQKAYLSQFFDSENAEFQHWRDTQLTQWKDDKLTERRIRLAIREKADLAPWLNLLSVSSQQKEEWQYWIAQQADPEKKQHILTALSTQRSFYAMLAAQELGIPYQPEMLHFTLNVEEPTPVTTKKTNGKAKQGKDAATQQVAENQTVEKRFAKVLARITELRYFHDDRNMNSEWANLLKPLSQNDQLALADYAAKQGWYDLSVEATIQAKAWGYLSLRLPNAYRQWFDLHLNGKQIKRTFAMAIARQESAWRPNVSSSANARGLMQLLPTTAKLTAQQTQLPYGDEQQLFDPFYNIMLGTAHLQQLYDKYGDNRILIAAAYNAGANRVDRWLEKSNGTLTMAEFVAAIPFYETRGYVQNVLAYDSYYQILQQQPQILFSQTEQDRLY
ncbi:transglycosylase SLT domain-containing protein [Lonepinella sp. BR2474]|uniref:transglycosylase SLT domain-containing protein n=1 Tax=Lonepinella sp. BR2474 TaxID=3434548 RepID=UPI003F6E3B5B